MIILQIIGGAGILLYSIDIMKSALEKASESRMEKMLGGLTKNRLSGIITGALVTIINQKSAATTAMVVGLVNAGVLTLVQAASVIMGANIGTTVTAQILAFPLETAAPAIIGAGVIVWRVTSHKKIHHIGEAMIGFGMMFIGMSVLKNGIIPLAEFSVIQNYLIHFDQTSMIKYMTAIVIGFVMAALSRSSTAIMGVIIAMSMQGILDFDLAMPLILGVNTGKCLPTLYLGSGVNRTARRATAMQMLFYCVGDVIFILFFRGFMDMAVGFLAPGDIPRQIAHAHTLFNLGNAMLLLPFVKLIVHASDKLIPSKNQREQVSFLNLDKRMLETPGLALAQSGHELTVMADTVFNNYANAFQAFVHQDGKLAELVHIEESNVNRMQKEIEAYLVKLSQKQISEGQQKQVKRYLGICADIERIGDLAENIIKFEEYGEENEVYLSETAMEEIKVLHEKISFLSVKAVQALETNDTKLAAQILEDSSGMEEWHKQMRDAHLERLNAGKCMPGSGVIFVDLTADMIAIAGHIQSICHVLIDGETVYYE